MPNNQRTLYAYSIHGRGRSGEISKALGIIGTAIGFDDKLVIDLNPVTAESFNEELEQFDRIRQASVTVARPNYDWTENANTLTTYAAESDGQTAELEISAPRGGSLAKERGIVRDIKKLVQHAIGPLKKVKTGQALFLAGHMFVASL